MEVSVFKEDSKYIIETDTDLSERNHEKNYVPLMPCKREHDVFPHISSNDQVKILDSENKDKFDYTYSNSYYTNYVEKDELVFHGFKCDLCNLLLLDKYILSNHCKSHVD